MRVLIISEKATDRALLKEMLVAQFPGIAWDVTLSPSVDLGFERARHSPFDFCLVQFSKADFVETIAKFDTLTARPEMLLVDSSGPTAADHLLRALRGHLNKKFFLSENAQSKEKQSKACLKKGFKDFDVKAIVIASSTGGPGALGQVFGMIKSPLSAPVFVVQHMPEGFTKSLASDLSKLSGLNVEEAKMKQAVQPKVYIAPGNFHMTLVKADRNIEIKLDRTSPRNSVRPAADYLFETAAEIYGPQLLGIVLTGMGEDGVAGAKAIKNSGGFIIIQSRESSTVWGMPGAVAENNLHDLMLEPTEIGKLIAQKIGGFQ